MPRLRDFCIFARHLPRCQPGLCDAPRDRGTARRISDDSWVHGCKNWNIRPVDRFDRSTPPAIQAGYLPAAIRTRRLPRARVCRAKHFDTLGGCFPSCITVPVNSYLPDTHRPEGFECLSKLFSRNLRDVFEIDPPSAGNESEVQSSENQRSDLRMGDDATRKPRP